VDVIGDGLIDVDGDGEMRNHLIEGSLVWRSFGPPPRDSRGEFDERSRRAGAQVEHVRKRPERGELHRHDRYVGEEPPQRIKLGRRDAIQRQEREEHRDVSGHPTGR
jgi:hypothetical protein